MKSEKEEIRVCANEGCGKPAETDCRFCEACALDWTLFHRDRRVAAPGPADRIPPA